MKTVRVLAGQFLFFACLGSISVQAQDQPTKHLTFDECVALFKQTAEAKEDEKVASTEAGLPLGSGEVAPLVTTDVSLVAGDKDGRGLLSYSVNSQTSSGQTTDKTIEVSVPFNKDENQAVFASLGGLSGDILLTGAFSRHNWNIHPEAYGQKLCTACQEAGVTPLENCNLGSLEEKLKETHSAVESRQITQAIEDLLFGSNTGRIWGVEASAGRKERSFFEPDASKVKEDRIAYSFSLTGGLSFKNSSLHGKLVGKRDYKEMNKATFCSTLPGSVLENCTALPFGRAKSTNSLVVAAEDRFFMRDFAFAPSVEYDFESDIWGLEAPIFLVRNDSGDFTGGVKFSWRSDQNDVAAAVFVTKGLKP